MRLSFTLNKQVNTLFINNGVLGVIYGKTIDFFNLLGGNSVLISCFGYNTIQSAVVDNLNNILITYDTANNIIFYDLKLSISRVSSNECYPIYRLETLPIDDFNNKNYKSINENPVIYNENEEKEEYFSSTKDVIGMQIFKNYLILMKGNKYLIVLDLTFNQKNPEIEKVIHYKEFLLNANFENSKIKAFTQIKNKIEKRDIYMDSFYDELFKVTLINKNEIYIISKLSNFDLGLFSFSKENFSLKNFFLTKDYFESTHVPLTDYEIEEYPLIRKNKEDLISTKKNININDLINYNFFNLNISKIKVDYLQTQNGNLILKQSNTLLNKKHPYNSTESYYEAEKSSFKNNLYYKLFYSNVNSVVLYGFVILAVIIFCFLLRLYYNKMKEENERLIKEKMEELQKLNLNKLKGRTDLFGNEENLINKNVDSVKIESTKSKMDENNKINTNQTQTEKNDFLEAQIKSSFMNINKKNKSSDEDSLDDLSNKENKFVPDSIDAKASIKYFINREKNKLGTTKYSKFKEESY